MTNPDLIAARAMLQKLLDNYQVRDPGMVDFQSALVLVDGVIATPDAPPTEIVQTVTGTQDVIDGVMAGLRGTNDILASVLLNTAQIKAGIAGLEGDTTALRADTGQLRDSTQHLVDTLAPFNVPA